MKNMDLNSEAYLIECYLQEYKAFLTEELKNPFGCGLLRPSR